jgi:SagB-type dehydrogenase family enzyme
MNKNMPPSIYNKKIQQRREDPKSEELVQPLDLAELFHENTKISSYRMKDRKGLEINSHPLIIQLTSIPPKQYRSSLHIKLPYINHKTMNLKMPLVEAIRLRRSTRQFSSRALSLYKLSNILYFSNAVLKTSIEGETKIHHRTVPSSGGLCSIEVYPIVLNVKGLKQGIYHYDSLSNDLACLNNGNFREQLQKKMLFQQEFADASVILVITSWFSKLKFKYKERGYRYGLLDAGHVGAYVYLLSTALNLACCGICGFLDDEVNDLIGVNGLDECAIYLLAIGEK